METKIETKQDGIVTIHANGELVGIVYNDMSVKAKRLYWVQEMSVEDIKDLLMGQISTVSVSPAIAKKEV